MSTWMDILKDKICKLEDHVEEFSWKAGTEDKKIENIKEKLRHYR